MAMENNNNLKNKYSIPSFPSLRGEGRGWLAFLLMLALTFSATAQTITSASGDAHKNMHKQLLAKQASHAEDQIQLVEHYTFIDLLEDDIEPEPDIYTEGWNSQSVNPFKEADVPDTQVIDVTGYYMPCPGYITSNYGYRRKFGRMHKGIDLKIERNDTIYAAFDGKVRLTAYERKGYGYYIIIRHPNGLETVYGHLNKHLVKPDQVVRAGDPIALGGSTGRSTGPHLHFETRFMGYAINPAAIFDFENQTTHTDTYTFDKKSFTQSRNYAPSKSRTTSTKKKTTGTAKKSTGTTAKKTSSGKSTGTAKKSTGTAAKKTSSAKSTGTAKKSTGTAKKSTGSTATKKSSK